MISGFSKYAIQCHKDTNHLYDGYLPYEFHLKMTVANAKRFMHLVQPEINNPNMPTIIYCGCWGHDLIEDCRQTYSSVSEALTKAYFNSGHPYSKTETIDSIADIIYAVSNEKGKNRKERENDKYVSGIHRTPYATFVKLCDRLANIQYSKMTAWESDAKLKMYKKEHAHFKEKLWDERYKEMFDCMDELLGENIGESPIKKTDSIEWKMPSNKTDERVFCDGHLRAGYLENDLTEALNFIEMITRAPVVNASDVVLNKEAEQFLKKFKP